MTDRRAFIPPFEPRRIDKVSERFFAPRAHSLFGSGAMPFATVVETAAGLLVVSEFRPNQLNWGIDDPSGTMSLQLVCAQAADTPGRVLSTMVTSGEPLEPVDEKIHAGRLEVAGCLSDLWKVIPLDPNAALSEEGTRERQALPDSIYGNSLRGGSGLLVMAALDSTQGLILTREGMGPMNTIFTMGSFPTDENDFRCQGGELPLAIHNTALFSSQVNKVTDEPSTALSLRFGAPPDEPDAQSPGKLQVKFVFAGFVKVTPFPPGTMPPNTLLGRTGRVLGGTKKTPLFGGRRAQDKKFNILFRDPLTGTKTGAEIPGTAAFKKRQAFEKKVTRLAKSGFRGYVPAPEGIETQGAIVSPVDNSGQDNVSIRRRDGSTESFQFDQRKRTIKTFYGKLVPFNERDKKPKNKEIDQFDPLVAQADHNWAPCVTIDIEDTQGKQDRRAPGTPGPGKKGPKGPKGERGPKGNPPPKPKQKPPRGPGSKKGDKKKKGGGSKQQRSPFGGTKGANDQGSSSDTINADGVLKGAAAGAAGLAAGFVDMGVPSGVGEAIGAVAKVLAESAGGEIGKQRTDCPRPPDDKSGGSPKAGDGVEADSIEVADDLDFGEEVSIDELPASEDDTTPAPTPSDGTPTDKTAKKCPTVGMTRPRVPDPPDVPEEETDLDADPTGDRLDPETGGLKSEIELPGDTTMDEAITASWDPISEEYAGICSVGASAELGGYGGDPRAAFVQEPSGRWNVVSVPAPGDVVRADEMAALINYFKPPGISRTPPPGMPGAGRDIFGYVQQLQAQLDEVHSILDAAFVGDRSPYYEGNIVVVHTNQPIDAKGDGEGVAENYIGNHYIDPESGPGDSLAAGLNVLQVIEGDTKQVTVDRAALRVQRHLHGRVAATAAGGRPVIAAEKQTTGGAIDKSPWVGAWEGPGLIPPFAFSHSGALGLRSQNFVPTDEQIAGLAHFFNRNNRPFFQTAGPNPTIVDLAAFQSFDGINVSDYAEGFTSWNVDEDGNVIVSSEAEQARLGYPSF